MTELNALGQALGWTVLSPNQMSRVTPEFSDIGYAQSLQRGLAFVALEGVTGLLMTDPFAVEHRTWAFMQNPQACRQVWMVSEKSFNEWLERWEDQFSALQSESPTDPASVPDTPLASELTLAGIDAESNIVVRFVAATMLDALKAGASDIHLESDESGVVVKLRLDGVLSAAGRLDGRESAEQVISRIKVMSDLDIAERRVPQDGRLSVKFRGRSIDIRVSIMPSVHGEDVVLRVLDRGHLAQKLEGLSLAKLGFDAHTVERFTRLCARPYGMVLVTGPTGSGKTTTLYAALSETRDPREKVITIEDPVEYQLSGVLQIPVNEKKGLTFARGLRSILRHDPDCILVGEIRDEETARIAVQSALTGHLVYTTVHANNAFDVLSRFTQLGVDAYELSSALSGVLAQRLLRTVCPHCCVFDSAKSADGNNSDASRHGTSSRLVRAVGCEHCRHTGYRGRRAIGELLLITSEIKSALAQRQSIAQLQAIAEREGLVSLRAQALRLAESGLTTMQEVDRVTVLA